MAEKDDFLRSVENQLELKKSGIAPKKNTEPFDLTKYAYRPVQKRNQPVQNRRVIGDFAGPLKKPFDTDILVDQNLEPIKYKTLTGDIKEMSGHQAESGPVKSGSKKVGQKRYIDQNKIDVIKAFLSQQIEAVSAQVSESTGPSFVYERDKEGNLITNKKGQPIKRLLGGHVWEHGRGKFELREKGEFAAYDAWGEQKKSVKNPANASNWVWVPDAAGEVPYSYSMSSTTSQSGEIKHTPWEKVEGFFSEALKKSEERGYHLFQTSKLKKHSKTGKSFDRDIVVSHEAFKEIIQNEVVPMLFAKEKDTSSKFSFGNIDMNTPRKRLEKMQGQVVLGEGGSTLTEDIRSTEFRFGEARGSDDLSFDEKVGLGQTGWGEASTDIKGEGFEIGKHKTGQDVSDSNISKGILPDKDPLLGKELERAKHKQPYFQLDEDPSYLSSMEIDPKKDAAKQLLHGVLMDEVLEEARKTQHVQAGSATGDTVDIHRIHQYTTDDFVGLDENQTVQEEMEEIRKQYNNIIKEHDLGGKAWYQETTKLLQKHQAAEVAQLRKIDPILAHLVLRGAQTQKAIQEPLDSGVTAKDKKLPGIKMRVEGEKAIPVEPSSKVPFPSIQQSKKLSVQRDRNPHLHARELPAWHKTEKEAEVSAQKKSMEGSSRWHVLDYFTSKGLISEFVSGPEPEVNLKEWIKESPLAGKKSGIGEQIVAPEAETIVPQKTTSVTVDGKSHVLTHNVNIHPGPRSTQLTLGIDPGEVPEIVSNKPQQITEYPSIAHDPNRPLQDQLDMRKAPTVVSGEVDTKGAFPFQQQASLFEGETIDMKQSRLTGDWMTRQEQLRRGEQALHGKINPKLGVFGFGLGLTSSVLSPMVAYKDVERLNQQEADTHAFGDDEPLNPRPVTEQDFQQQFWSRLTMGIIPSVQQLRWQRQIDPGAGISPDA